MVLEWGKEMREWGRMKGKQLLTIKHLQELKNHISFGSFPPPIALAPLKARKGQPLTMENLLDCVFSLEKWEGFPGSGLKTYVLWTATFVPNGKEVALFAWV